MLCPTAIRWGLSNETRPIVVIGGITARQYCRKHLLFLTVVGGDKNFGKTRSIEGSRRSSDEG
jgi:hypothetical protein